MECITTLIIFKLNLFEFTKDWLIAVITGVGLAFTLKRELFAHLKDYMYLSLFIIFSWLLGGLFFLLIESIFCRII